MTASATDPSVAFSVCIPNFNYGRYIGATIRSVLEQTYPFYEIVVVDNASTDDSVAVVESLQSTSGISDLIRLYRNSSNVGFARTSIAQLARRATPSSSCSRLTI